MEFLVKRTIRLTKVLQNSVVCINAEGNAHIFDLDNFTLHDGTKRSSSATQGNNLLTAEEYLQHSRRGSDTATLHSFRNAMANAQNGSGGGQKSTRGKSQLGKGEEEVVMQHIAPNHTVKVPVNVNKIIIADIDGDGMNEVVLARTDRILHSFELRQTRPSEDSSRPNTVPDAPSTSTSTSSASVTPNTYTRQNPLAGKSMRSSITQSSLQMAKERPLPPSRATTKEEINEKSTISKISTGWGKRDKSRPKTDESINANDDTEDDSGSKAAPLTSIVEKDMWIFDGQVRIECVV
jgi:hypothetical protein